MFQPNSVIAGRYQVIRLVGQGGMSNLYLAYDRKYNNAIVVVKEMTAAYSDPKEQQMAVELFHREAKLLASLNHRHIPKVYDYFQFAGKYYLSMEFIDGEDLAQKLEKTKGPLPEAQVLEWGEQIATVLFYLHKHDPPIVFRDVKPSNIMLCEQGVKLIDFGIARHFDKNKKGDTMRIGSPGYAPPEQYSQQTDPRSDIYALGVTLHHALTGRDPTATQTPFLVPPARNLNPALSEATAAMLARATQLSPEDRYQNILDMKNDIKQILSRGKQGTRVVHGPPAPPPGPAVAPAAGIAVGAAGAAASPAATPAPPGPAATPSAAPPAAVSTAGTPAAPPASGAPAAGTAPAATPARKRRRLKPLLLAASVLLLVTGGLFLAGPEGRQAAGEKLKSFFASLPRGGSPESAIADALQNAVKTGNPQSLLSLFSDGQLANLSQDKQALYRLNLLAAGVAGPDSPATIVHLLYPEGLEQDGQADGLYRVAARAVAAINGGGGIEKSLLVVLPRAYRAGALDAALSRLSRDATATSGQPVVILDPASEAAGLSPQNKALQPFVLAPSDPGGLPWLATLPAGQENRSLFDLASASGELGKVLWAATGEPPAGKVEKVEFVDSADSLNRLLQRSQTEQATVVVEAARLKDLQGLSEEGRLLLLAIGPDSLPDLPPGRKAQALVLGSPLRPVAGARGTAFPSGELKPAEARLLDGLHLATIPAEQSYSGLTVSKSSKAKDQPGVPVLYRWTASGWVPDLRE